MDLLLGTAKIDITPEHPVPLAGYGHRKGVMDGVSHPIYLRVALFEQIGETGRHTQLVASADMIWWGTERMEKLIGKLTERFGLRRSDVILTASHSHSGPQTSALMPHIGLIDESYVQSLENKLVACVEEAQSNLEPVTVERGSSTCDVGVNRRKYMNGVVHFEPNPEGPNDNTVTVIRFRNESGEAKALFVHYTCHPTVTNANLISAEYSGIAMEEVERELGGRSVALFLQGCCGNIRPALVRDGKFYNGGDAEVREMGARLKGAVLRALDGSLQKLALRKLNGDYASCELPYQLVPSREMLEETFEKGEERERNWADQLLHDSTLIRESVPLELVRLDIADGLTLLSMNAEMVVEYGLYVKAVSAGDVLPVAYSNGMIGYVSTAEQLNEGGYEATGSYYYFGLCSPFSQASEGIIKETVDYLLAGGRAGKSLNS